MRKSSSPPRRDRRVIPPGAHPWKVPVNRPEALLYGPLVKLPTTPSTSWWLNVPRDDWQLVSSTHNARLARSREGNRRAALD